jgi:hypothetical protein
MDHFYKIKLLPDLGGDQANLNVYQVQFKRCWHGSIELQEEITCFPEFKGLKAHLSFNVFEHHR